MSSRTVGDAVVSLRRASVGIVPNERDESAIVEPALRHAASDLGAAAQSPLELTILMPCLNEALTLSACIGKAKAFLAHAGIDGEVLVADNGSTDGSQTLATACGARVIDVPVRG